MPLRRFHSVPEFMKLGGGAENEEQFFKRNKQMWRTLTEGDVHDLMNEVEVESFTSEELVETQGNPLPDIIERVTEEFRQSIRTCDRNTLSDDPLLLPEGVIGRAAIVARHRLLTRFDTFVIGDSRMEEFRSAERFLRDLAMCKPTVEHPTGRDSDRQRRPGAQYIEGAGGGRKVTREALNGL